MTLTAVDLNVIAGVVGSLTKATDNTSPTDPVGINKAVRFTYGTGTNQINEGVHDRRSLAATSENIDLQATLANAFGDNPVFTKIRAVLFFNRETTSGYDLTLTGNFMKRFAGGTPQHVVPPGGVYLITSPIDGWVVTDTTFDTITANSGANTVAYDVVILGII